jgi:hypothetical protein
LTPMEVAWPTATFLLTTISLIAKIRKQSICSIGWQHNTSLIYIHVYIWWAC